MFVYIDESGVHQQAGKTTTALVYVKTEQVERLDRAILQTEKNLGIQPFHWSKQIWKIRQAFLSELLSESFEVKILLFQNPFTEEKWEQGIKRLLVEKHIKYIIIDGSKPRRYTLHLKQVLRQSGVSVKKIRIGNDRAFPGLRLADFFAGLTRSHFQDPNNEEARRLFKIAKNKITTQFLGGQVPASL